jgi:hypothetical protein
MERSFIIVKYCCSQRNATKLATTSPTCKGQTLAGGGSKVMDAWQRKALGAELFNLLRVFDALGPIAVHSRDSRRRLELRRRSGVRSHSIYESSRHFDSRPLGAESSWAVQGCTPLITPTHVQRPTGGSARFSASNQTGAVKNIVAIPRSPRCSVCFSDLVRGPDGSAEGYKPWNAATDSANRTLLRVRRYRPASFLQRERRRRK